MWGWGHVRLDVGDSPAPQPALIVSARHCKNCDVGWSNDTKCWMCGRFGDAGGVPLPGVVVNPHQFRTWFGND